MLRAGMDDLTRFVRAIYAHASPAGEIDLRAFHDHGADGGTGAGDPNRRIFKRQRIGSGDLNAAIAAAQAIIESAAAAQASVVFCPPVCVFKPGIKTAREADVLEGLCLSIELDREPEVGLAKAEIALGRATLVVASGGAWHNDVLDESEAKMHAYWVLSVPARTPLELARLKYLRKLATAIAGGDVSNVPLVHPIRWPGSWHRKNPGAPVMARILRNAGGEYLTESLVVLAEAATAKAGLTVRGGPLGTAAVRSDDRETLDLVKNIVTGSELHPSLVPLAMRLAVAHVPRNICLTLLRGMMHGAGSASDARWSARYGELDGIVGSAYAKIDFAAPADNWKLALDVGPKGAIITDWQNVFRAFQTAPQLKHVVRYNTRSAGIEVAAGLPWSSGVKLPRAWDDSDTTYSCVWLNREGFSKVNYNMVHRAVDAAARLNKYDPVMEYLHALSWDGVPRVDGWLVKYCGAADSAYVREIGARWLLQAVARVLTPGCQADCVLILEGRQGVRKSTVLAKLGEPWYTELTADISHGGKDTLMALTNAWIIEISELDALRKADVARIKAFFSQRVDRYRMPYDRTTKDYPRSVVFAGTLNPDGNEYLQDTTGNRRFWPVEVAGVEGVSGGKFIDTDGLARDRNQLWAETVSRVGRGERIWTHDSGLQIAVEKEQRDRTYSDPWTEHIKSWVERYEEKQFTMVDILSLGLNIPVRDHDRRHQIRVSRILRELNVIKIHTLTGKKWLKIDQ